MGKTGKTEKSPISFIEIELCSNRWKRDSLCASQRGILGKHRKRKARLVFSYQFLKSFPKERDSLRASLNGNPIQTWNPKYAKRILFSVFYHSLKQVWFVYKNTKPATLVAGFFCGERGIRTPGGVTLASFQD